MIKMKKILYTALSLVLLATACTDNSLEDQGIEVEELGKYVAFSVNGVGTSPENQTIREDGGDTDDNINVEIPGGSVSDITINYTFSGTAVFGTDFTIDGATANGGSVVITQPTEPVVDGLPLNVDIVVSALTDGVVDGEKTLNINLASASNADGEILVGRAGTDFLKTVAVTFEDSDYVAFSSSSLSVTEGQEDVSITLEAYPGNERDSDVTVTYTLGGTAVFGTDYTIAGATAAGGTVIIVPNVEEAGNPSTLDLDVVILDNTDISADDAEPKTIEITLTGASDTKESELTLGEDGELDVATITIGDNDSDYISFDSASERKLVGENDGSVSLTLEAYPGDKRGTVTVNYTVTGTAELGVDYTLVSASTTDDVTTGTTTITSNVDADDPFGPSIATFQVILLTDDMKDGNKTIIITLDDASEAGNSDIPVGVNGTSTLSTATITIADID